MGCSHWKPRPLRYKDDGVILGPAPPPHDVWVRFTGRPVLEGKLTFADICRTQDFQARMSACGFIVGESVRSIVTDEGRQPIPLSYGELGVVAGPAPGASDIWVDFRLGTLVKLRTYEICR